LAGIEIGVAKLNIVVATGYACPITVDPSIK
jgi:hypothetical protein